MSRKRVSEKEIVVSATAVTHRKAATTARAKRSASISASAPVTQPVQDSPSREQIAALAYSYWETRGFQGGSPEQDWLRAEQELAGKPALTATAVA